MPDDHGVDDALVADATCERHSLADLEPEGVGCRTHDPELDRLVGGRGLGPGTIEQLSVLLHALEGAQGREVADLVRVLAGQREAVGDADRDDVEPDRPERRAQGFADGGIGGADRRRIDPGDHLDACVGDRRRFELTVQAGDRHRARVDRARRQQAAREERDETCCSDDGPVGPRPVQADPPRSNERLHDARFSLGWRPTVHQATDETPQRARTFPAVDRGRQTASIVTPLAPPRSSISNRSVAAP